jgi:hypothetical protein
MIHGKGAKELLAFLAEHPDWIMIDHSRLERWEQCPRKYKYEYVDNMYRESSYDAEFGNLLHKLLGEWYLKGPSWNPDQSFLNRIWNQFLDVCYNAPSPQANRAAVFTLEHAMRAFAAYKERYAPDFETYDVVDSETLYFREIMPGVLWVSKPDLILRRKGDQQLVTLDFKHSVWEFNRNLLSFDRQFVGQSFAAESKWMIKVFFHSQTPLPGRTGAPVVRIYRDVEPADGELASEWLNETIMMIKPILEAKQTGVYPKRAPRACMDFNRLCQFAEICQIGKIAGQIMIDAREKTNPNDYLGM